MAAPRAMTTGTDTTRTRDRRLRWLPRATAVGLALTLGACSTPADPPVAGPDAPADPTGGTVFGIRSSAPTLLRSGQSCDALLDEFQSIAAESGMGQFTRGVAFDGDAALATAGSADMDTAAEASQTPPGGSSSTNTQEAGIDEPDTVETDGAHVFLVDGRNLVVLDGATAAVVSRTELGGDGAQLLLDGDRLIVLSSTWDGFETDPQPASDVGATVDAIGPGYGRSTTVVELFDVADVAAPSLVQRSEVEGSQVTARVVDGVARVVVSNAPYPQVFIDAVDQPMSIGDVSARDADDLDAAVEDAISSTSIEDWLPRFRSTDFGGRVGGEKTQSGIAGSCQDVFVPDVGAGITETSILRVDFATGFDPAATTTIVGDAGSVYASTSTLYLAATAYVTPDGQASIDQEDWTTAIHAFDLRGDGAAVHLAAGSVPGSTLNQYSLSEFGGDLRIATTTGVPWAEQSTSESGVHILRASDGELREIGAVTGLGKTETIQSVRFMGPVGYVVTFRQTDPLYVIDLSDPAAPVSVGELKIPGFSSYLHPAGDGRLIGIGRDADEEGRDLGFALSLFDVSDPTDPRQIQRFTTPNTHSMAEYDPKAFLWWADEATVVVPLDRYDDDSTSSGMAVFDVGDGGIDLRDLVQVDGRYPSRALVVQGALWSIFDGGVAVSDFDSVAQASFTPFGS